MSDMFHTCVLRVPGRPESAPVQLPVLMDTGAQASLIPEKCLPKDATLWPLTSKRRIHGAAVSGHGSTHYTYLEVQAGPLLPFQEVAFFVADVNFPILRKADMIGIGFDISAPPLSPFTGPPKHEFEAAITMEPLKFSIGRDQVLKFIDHVLSMNKTIKGPSTNPLAVWHADLVDPNITYQAPRFNFSPEVTAQVAEAIQQLLEQSVVEEVDAPEGNCLSLVAVTKKGGDIRVCLNPALLNANLRKHPFEMNVSIQSLLRRVAKGRIYTHLDLKSAFHSCPVHEDSRKYLVFRFGDRFYRYLRTPFGIANLPAHFSQLMNSILGDLPFVVFYIDDIVIISDTPEEHAHHVAQVLERLNENNLVLNIEKCVFAVTEAKILGYIVSHNRIAADPEKIALIRALQRPKNATELRGFVSQVNYLRQHIPSFGVLAAPLYEMLTLRYNEGMTLKKGRRASRPSSS